MECGDSPAIADAPRLMEATEEELLFPSDAPDRLMPPHEQDLPSSTAISPESLPATADSPDDGGTSLASPEGDEIEAAYQRALSAMEELEGVDGASPSPASNVGTSDQPPTTVDAPPATDPPGSDPGAVAPPAAPARSATEAAPAPGQADPPQVTPAQIVEAALFVGGGPLATKRLCALLRGGFDAAFIERTIDELNGRYASEGRPYEIRLGEGGYRLELRPEFERLRQRVYGTGPREVRLSQEVLEVLALVAYRQPLSQADVESHGKENAGNLLRQLLRRDLVLLERGPGGRKDVLYRTTPRFLALFGLASLDELPRPEDLERK